jgi:hypothetical protein
VSETRCSCCIAFKIFVLIWHHFLVISCMAKGIQKVWMSVKVVTCLSRCVNGVVVLQLCSFFCNTKILAARNKSSFSSTFSVHVKIATFERIMFIDFVLRLMFLKHNVLETGSVSIFR